MDFLERILGIRVKNLGESEYLMPNYIYDRYSVHRVLLDNIMSVFVYPKTELDSISSVKKHINKIEQAENAKAVLVLNHLTYRQKEYLLRDHIPFIVDGKQIYLPFMAVYLQERNDSEKPNISSILPSAQMLLLYFIYNGCRVMPTNEAAHDLGLTSTSISRASRQLAEMGLVKAEKTGVQKMMFSNKTPEQLFDFAREYLCNPVKRTIYVPKNKVKEVLLLSGYSALSEHSNINPPAVECYATNSVADWDKIATSSLISAEEQCEIQLWRYNPRKLSSGNSVDRLSLALSLLEDPDERAEEALGYMLSNTWRDIDGKRNR